MAGRTLQFFARRDEFIGILAPIAEALSLIAITEQQRHPSWRPLPLVSHDFGDFGRIFLVPVDLDLAYDLMTPSAPAHIVVDLPLERENVLLMANVSVKSDWYDHKTQRAFDNPVLFNIYNRLAARLRRRLLFPAVATNIVSGASGVYRGIGYTPAAKAFADQGGAWMQNGVKNLRFGPAADADRKDRGV